MIQIAILVGGPMNVAVQALAPCSLFTHRTDRTNTANSVQWMCRLFSGVVPRKARPALDRLVRDRPAVTRSAGQRRRHSSGCTRRLVRIGGVRLPAAVPGAASPFDLVEVPRVSVLLDPRLHGRAQWRTVLHLSGVTFPVDRSNGSASGIGSGGSKPAGVMVSWARDLGGAPVGEVHGYACLLHLREYACRNRITSSTAKAGIP